MGLIRGVSGVRGIVGQDITDETASLYGRAFGSLVGGAVGVGRDSRRGGERLANAVMRGLRESGAGAFDLGVVPTPTIGIATRSRGLAGGVAVTASHNPEEWNGFKFFSPAGVFLTRDEVARVFRLADEGVAPARDAGPAVERIDGAAADHVELVMASPFVGREAVARMRPRVVLDCVNAAGSVVLPALLGRLGCDVVELSCDAGRPFSRGAEPVPENLLALSAAVVRERAAIGLACDPDADRLAVVDERGRAVGEEYTLAIAADTVLGKRKGPVVANVSTSLMIEDVARAHGVPAYRTAVGDINVVVRMMEVAAVVGGEGNGGVIVPSIHPGRDAAVAAALVLTALAESPSGLASGLVSCLPTYAMVKRKVAASVPSGEALVEAMTSAFPGGVPDLTDGAKICWPDRWVHVRMSGTEPIVRLIAEARREADADALVRRAAEIVSPALGRNALMCGIIGVVTDTRDTVPILVDGLRRMEYRGYDSAGLAVVEGGGLLVRKARGKIDDLQRLLDRDPVQGLTGVAHTRWATHGEPSDRNAHPQLDCTGKIAVVHNGIVENCVSLRKSLEGRGHVFTSETDTEVLAHLIEENYHGNLEAAVRAALAWVQGAYGIAVIHADEPRKIVGARNGSPLVIGIAKDGYYVASDVAALVRYTRDVVYLDDLEMVVATPDGFSTTTLQNELVTKDVERVTWNVDKIERNGYPHFMLKEIFEQERTVTDAVRGRLIEAAGDALLGGLREHRRALNDAKRIIIIACGTSWHAGLIGEYMIEDLARVSVEVEYASEFRYRNPVINPGDIVLVISQSGETADTAAAMIEAQRRGAIVLGIVNVVGSTIARRSDGGVYVHAGPEIGVASTKAFTSQLMVLAALALMLGRSRNISVTEGRAIVRAMREIPDQIAQILAKNDEIAEIAKRFAKHSNFLYLGRGYNFPVALEGALKLKEISYIHAEGYPAAEMKHGPIALIDENMPIVVIAPHDAFLKKILSNMQELKTRGGRIIAVTSQGDDQVVRMADAVIEVPRTLPHLTPILSVVPLQLLAYHMAVERGCHVDQPRNLAKSVTVE